MLACCEGREKKSGVFTFQWIFQIFFIYLQKTLFFTATAAVSWCCVDLMCERKRKKNQICTSRKMVFEMSTCHITYAIHPYPVDIFTLEIFSLFYSDFFSIASNFACNFIFIFILFSEGASTCWKINFCRSSKTDDFSLHLKTLVRKVWVNN